MRVLLDSHTLLWWVTAPEILTPSTLDLLADSGNDVLISIVTPWELAIKASTGKLDPGELLYDLEHGNLEQEVRLIQTEVRHVLRAGRLPQHHRDPFDRLLIAQALELGIPIISNDQTFDRYGVQRIWG